MSTVKIPYHPLQNAADLDILMQEIGDSKIVLLGEASHGTSEFYFWRSAISKRLIEEKNFSFIAVEGDWPDCYAVNRFVKGYDNAGKSAREVLQVFKRWPTWMWGNWEIAALADYLKEYNSTKSNSRKIGFYGLDVYSLWESLEAIMQYLQKRDGSVIQYAREAIKCFEPYNEDPHRYARATAGFVPADCTDEVIEMLQKLREKKSIFAGDPEGQFDTEQNALVAVNAEKYYRAMVRGSASSWNVRDEHMMETLNRLLEFHGENARAIVWEHNTHVGDARATDMARAGMVNVGQLAREEYGDENCFIVGFGTYKGSVIAGDEWEAPMEEMHVPEAKHGSWEHMLHTLSEENKLLLAEELRQNDSLNEYIGHRAIGVVYNPHMERYGNYVPSKIPQRYDAFLFIDETTALHPLLIKEEHKLPPELYPWNV